jgi:hypothetical protein
LALNATLFFFEPVESKTLDLIGEKIDEKQTRIHDWILTQEDPQTFHGVGKAIDTLKDLSHDFRAIGLEFQIEIFEDSDRLVTRIIS